MANIIEITDKCPLKNKKIMIDRHTAVQIKTYLSVEDYTEAIQTVVDSCFVNGEYFSAFKDVAIRYMVLTTFTDIDLGDMPVEEVFKVTQNNWYYVIEKEVSMLPIYSEILDSVDNAIEYKIRTRSTSFDYLCDVLGEFAEKMGDVSPLEKIASKIEKLNDKEIAKAIVEKDGDK